MRGAATTTTKTRSGRLESFAHDARSRLDFLVSSDLRGLDFLGGLDFLVSVSDLRWRDFLGGVDSLVSVSDLRGPDFLGGFRLGRRCGGIGMSVCGHESREMTMRNSFPCATAWPFRASFLFFGHPHHCSDSIKKRRFVKIDGLVRQCVFLLMTVRS